MDNHKSYVPRSVEKWKDTAGTERLPAKITGCLTYSGWFADKRKCEFYINHDQVMMVAIF